MSVSDTFRFVLREQGARSICDLCYRANLIPALAKLARKQDSLAIDLMVTNVRIVETSKLVTTRLHRLKHFHVFTTSRIEARITPSLMNLRFRQLRHSAVGRCRIIHNRQGIQIAVVGGTTEVLVTRQIRLASAITDMTVRIWSAPYDQSKQES